MYDELTEVDIKKMQEEINYRTRVLRPQLIEEVQTARAFGDLSENYEYKCAKQAKNRNDSRIRYLERMIRTAKVIEVKDQGRREPGDQQLLSRQIKRRREHHVVFVVPQVHHLPEGESLSGRAGRLLRGPGY